MKASQTISSCASFFAMVSFCFPVLAGTSVQVGESGKTYASSVVSCAADPVTGVMSPIIEEVGLYEPKKNASATVSLNDVLVESVTAVDPTVTVWLEYGANNIVVTVNKHTSDTYTFSVPLGTCNLPDTSGNTFSADGTLEYAASGKSYATVAVGCALNPLSGVAQPYVHLFDNGNYLLNVSVNGLPLTQLSPLHSHTPVFLGAAVNVISAANGFVSTDYYIRDGGDGTCVLQ